MSFLCGENLMWLFCNPDFCQLQVLEPIPQLNEDLEIISIFVCQFEPHSLTCNSLTKYQTDKAKIKSISGKFTVDVKTSRGVLLLVKGKRPWKNFMKK